MTLTATPHIVSARRGAAPASLAGRLAAGEASAVVTFAGQGVDVLDELAALVAQRPELRTGVALGTEVLTAVARSELALALGRVPAWRRRRRLGPGPRRRAAGGVPARRGGRVSAQPARPGAAVAGAVGGCARGRGARRLDPRAGRALPGPAGGAAGGRGARRRGLRRAARSAPRARRGAGAAHVRRGGRSLADGGDRRRVARAPGAAARRRDRRARQHADAARRRRCARGARPAAFAAARRRRGARRPSAGTGAAAARRCASSGRRWASTCRFTPRRWPSRWRASRRGAERFVGRHGRRCWASPAGSRARSSSSRSAGTRSPRRSRRSAPTGCSISGPGTAVARLTAENLRGSGVRTLALASPEGRRVLTSPGAAPAARDVTYAELAPRVVALPGGRRHLDTRYTRLTGRPPVILAGMTPTTVDAPIVAAAANAGYMAELAGGGQPDRRTFSTARGGARRAARAGARGRLQHAAARPAPVGAARLAGRAAVRRAASGSAVRGADGVGRHPRRRRGDRAARQARGRGHARQRLQAGDRRPGAAAAGDRRRRAPPHDRGAPRRRPRGRPPLLGGPRGAAARDLPRAAPASERARLRRWRDRDAGARRRPAVRHLGARARRRRSCRSTRC